MLGAFEGLGVVKSQLSCSSLFLFVLLGPLSLLRAEVDCLQPRDQFADFTDRLEPPPGQFLRRICCRQRRAKEWRQNSQNRFGFIS